jgi:hypothetical protein
MLDEARDVVPVDKRRNRARDDGREPKPRKLFHAPGVDENILGGFLAFGVAQLVHGLTPFTFVVQARRITAQWLDVIEASGDSHHLVARTFGVPASPCVEAVGWRSTCWQEEHMQAS